MIFFSTVDFWMNLNAMAKALQADRVELKLTCTGLQFGFINGTGLITFSVNACIDFIEAGQVSFDADFLDTIDFNDIGQIEFAVSEKYCYWHLYSKTQEDDVVSNYKCDKLITNFLLPDSRSFERGYELNLTQHDIKLLKANSGNWIHFTSGSIVSNTDKWAFLIDSAYQGYTFTISKSSFKYLSPGTYTVFVISDRVWFFDGAYFIPFVNIVGFDYVKLIEAIRADYNKIQQVQSVPSGFLISFLDGANCYATGGLTKIVNGSAMFLYRAEILPESRSKPKTFKGVSID